MDIRKILFAYDGSECANQALEDLKRAGLPPELDLLVVTVAEVWVLPTEDDAGEDGSGLADADTTVARGIAISNHAKAGLEQAQILATHAANKIRGYFPGWNVETRVYPDSPAWGILHIAGKWNPDLIVLGSQGRSALGRFFVGSVSQKVLSEARCSVRIVRHRDCVEGSPVRLVVGVDGTPDSDAAVEAIASRPWPSGSSVKIVAAVGPISVIIDPAFSYDITQWPDGSQGLARQWEQMEQTAGKAAGKLRAAGLLVDTLVRDGAPVPLIIDEAEELGADCIFLGARGHRFMERFLLGSVSASVVARAGCTVEVIRMENDAQSNADAQN